MTEQRLRMLAAGLGIGVALFSGASLASPRGFARFFGISAPDPSVDSMIYSIGARDVAMGMGLWSAATHGGKYAPWLLARLIVDGGDAAGIAVAVARGWRNPRFLALGGLALGAAACDAVLWTAARRATASQSGFSAATASSLASTPAIK
ncbi:MAG TPA: DUF4267 domain-containing protein [Ktedonobacterales bacterium]|nr:DUF4267 domain-containing protein [Ktedonobacterales bacterium]